MPFYKKIEKTYRVTKLDLFVTIVAFIVFTYSFFFLSFTPIKDVDGNIVYTIVNGERRTIPEINIQVYLAPIILIYEMFQLFVLPGKTRLKYLPWRFWTSLFIFTIYKKILIGIQEYKNWRSERSCNHRQYNSNNSH